MNIRERVRSLSKSKDKKPTFLRGLPNDTDQWLEQSITGQMFFLIENNIDPTWANFTKTPSWVKIVDNHSESLRENYRQAWDRIYKQHEVEIDRRVPFGENPWPDEPTKTMNVT